MPGTLTAAEPGDTGRPNPHTAGGAAVADARVSMSPDEDPLTASLVPPAKRRTEESADARPLTRAAARRRLETISPIPWLARYGPVSLERHE